MIKEKDTIRMKIPYPTIHSGLAMTTHMYICKENIMHRCEFVKCQTLKPYMLTENVMKHYVDENAEIARNPFQRTTRIDCDKVFLTTSVEYDDSLKTTTRSDVCEELFNRVLSELDKDGYVVISINESELQSLNPLIRSIQNI